MQDAQELLTQMAHLAPREPGERLRAADEAKILEMHGQGYSQTDIASAVGCHQSTVSRTLAEYDDSRPLARRVLEAKAVEMARRLVTDAKPETILRVLAKLDVVRDDGRGVQEEGGTFIVSGSGGRTLAMEAPPGATLAELFRP